MMYDDVMKQFKAASGTKQQIFLAALIHHQTIVARNFYGAPDAASKLQLVNEHIHRLVGHLLSLISTGAQLEDSRVSAIGEVVRKLHPESQKRLGSFLDDHKPN
jgi:hypothetical protein